VEFDGTFRLPVIIIDSGITISTPCEILWNMYDPVLVIVFGKCTRCNLVHDANKDPGILVTPVKYLNPSKLLIFERCA
jgi:hypothetical protein